VYGKHIVKGTGLRAGRDSMHHLQVFACPGIVTPSPTNRGGYS
jgi:hypothetical protein